jgi:hypothetical protein
MSNLHSAADRRRQAYRITVAVLLATAAGGAERTARLARLMNIGPAIIPVTPETNLDQLAISFLRNSPGKINFFVFFIFLERNEV